MPYFSICIPQYNRTSFLIEVCRSLTQQTFIDFEVCISDDCSNDGRHQELIDFLEKSGLSFVYHRQEQNCRYDKNLRSAIGLSKGHYCFLLGNDDCLANQDVLKDLRDDVECFGSVGVAFTNYADYATGQNIRRISATAVLGTGPLVAALNYRNFSFVSGIVLDGSHARALATDKWDGSEMYQMFIGCRLIAAGGLLVGIDRIAVRKDIKLPDETVDSYALKPRVWPCPIIERRHTFDKLGRLVWDAVEPYAMAEQKQRLAESILRQLVLFTFPFWLFEFRRIQSWNYAMGICLGMRPKYFMHGIPLDTLRKLRLRILYLLVSLMGLTLPIQLFDKAYPSLYKFAKSRAANFTARITTG